jgi:hypothetical protein
VLPNDLRRSTDKRQDRAQILLAGGLPRQALRNRPFHYGMNISDYGILV